MVLHLPHAGGGFGVPFNCVTKDTAFYTTTSPFVSWIGAFSQARQELWLPKDDLRDSSSWSSPPLVLLRDIHANLIAQYDCKEVCAPSESQANIGASARLSSQTVTLSAPVRLQTCPCAPAVRWNRHLHNSSPPSFRSSCLVPLKRILSFRSWFFFGDFLAFPST
jgi:hypothetical protein